MLPVRFVILPAISQPLIHSPAIDASVGCVSAAAPGRWSNSSVGLVPQVPSRMFWAAMLRKARVYRSRPCTPVDATALDVVWSPGVLPAGP